VRVLLSALLVVATAACAPADGIVGVLPPDGGAPAPDWGSQLASDDGLWNVKAVLDGASVAFGARNAAATDGLVSELRFPGRAGAASDTDVGPKLATEIESKRTFQYGVFQTRLQFATCAPGEGVASAFFLFFRDGRDTDDNGLPDNPELDFQVLCDAPTFVVLTAWSDYAEPTSTAGERFRRLSRAVDLATGDLYDATSETSRGFAKVGNAPELARPSFVPGGFYDLRIDWQPTGVRFSIVLDGQELTLLRVDAPHYVPRVPMRLYLNLWHPATHWVPRTADAAYPAQDGVLRVDSVSWTAP
jgi:hypothetical protein